MIGRDLLGIDDLSREDIERILHTAEHMREVGERVVKKVPTLRGRTIVNLFFEPSTRTRASFEIAGKRLSADVLRADRFNLVLGPIKLYFSLLLNNDVFNLNRFHMNDLCWLTRSQLKRI